MEVDESQRNSPDPWRCIRRVCREYSSAMVSVPRGEHLADLLAGLPELERERLARSEVKLDRLARRDHGRPMGHAQ